MKKIMILAAGVMFAITAHAQISFAPEIGLNLANMHGKDKDSTGTEVKDDNKLKLGVKVGVNANIPVGDHLMIQPGLFYSIKGYKNEQSVSLLGLTFESKDNVTLHNFEIPVNVQYMFNDPGEGRFFVGVGGYVSIAFSGQDKASFSALGVSEDTTIKFKFGNDAPSNDLRRFDFGAQANAGYLLQSGIFFRAMYQAGISNMLPQGNRTSGEASLRSTNITISLGYQLGGRPESNKRKNKGGEGAM